MPAIETMVGAAVAIIAISIWLRFLNIEVGGMRLGTILIVTLVAFILLAVFGVI